MNVDSKQQKPSRLLQKGMVVILALGMLSCTPAQNESAQAESRHALKIVGAMKNVMWKGELGSSIDLDTLSNRKGLYGLGPQSYLSGELLINDGQAYLSQVRTDSSMSVEKTFAVSAPFFVYANVNSWQAIELPERVNSIAELETFMDETSNSIQRPFAFRLLGVVSSALIHIQNLPSGTAVSSPAEAHQGQVNYSLQEEEVEIVGFFSKDHAGIFTHHDSFLHMHLITKDESKMGHLDKAEFGTMTLYLPEE